MTAVALGLALAAAVTHATWNLLLSDAADTEAATAVALVAGVVIFAPLAAISGDVSSRATPYLILSNLLELAYFASLARAYDRGEASSVYPVARGTAPVLVLVGSLLVGSGVDVVEVLGVALVACGVTTLRKRSDEAGEGLGLACLSGLCIGGYTLVDKAGLRYADPLPYLALAMTAPAAAYCAAVLSRKRWSVVRTYVRPTTVVAGICVFGAYGLTLAALSRGPAAPVAAVREASIVILPLLAAIVLKRPVSSRQWLGAIVVTAGVIAVAL